MQNAAYYINGSIVGDVPKQHTIQQIIKLATAILYERLVEMIEDIQSKGITQNNSTGLVLIPIDRIKAYLVSSKQSSSLELVNELFLVRPDVYMSIQYFMVKYDCSFRGLQCASPEDIISDCVTQESTLEYISLLKEILRDTFIVQLEAALRLSRLSFKAARIDRENSSRGDSMLKYAIVLDFYEEESSETISIKLFSIGGGK